MNFFKEGKTNWKYILIVLILAVILGGGILGYWWIQRGQLQVPEFLIPEKETFTVIDYRKVPEKHQNVTVFGTSIPLDEVEAIRVFERIMGAKPSCSIGGEKVECPITKTDEGWQIVTGSRFLSDIYFTINEKDKIIRISGGY